MKSCSWQKLKSKKAKNHNGLFGNYQVLKNKKMCFSNRQCEHCTYSNRTFALLPSCLMLLELGVQWGLIVCSTQAVFAYQCPGYKEALVFRCQLILLVFGFCFKLHCSVNTGIQAHQYLCSNLEKCSRHVLFLCFT